MTPLEIKIGKNLSKLEEESNQYKRCGEGVSRREVEFIKDIKRLFEINSEEAMKLATKYNQIQSNIFMRYG